MTTKPLFSKVLIANRGEIAMRVLSALQSLGIPSVAIYHESDRNAPFVRLADEAVRIKGDSPSAAYLDIEQIVGICKSLGVDGVHPCYGFLSENANFAKALNEANVTFIGPQVAAIELMGDKIRSREFVQKHGFPVPPSLSLDVSDPGFVAAVSEMGFPLVVKASAGGGGKGMSIIRSTAELKDTIKIAASEAKQYFGDARVYVERYFERARHIEVQVLGDGKNVVHLGERECSVQRRFQKVIEESPSPALNAEQREAICATAVGIASAAKYTSAGTVEFLYTEAGEYFFLEMNTRIQVEHPVTEMVTGIDLVIEQIRIAAGQSLSMQQSDIRFNGHAIECRICAEDADDNFMPQTGKVLCLREPTGAGVRVDSGLYQGQAVTSAFDPMLAKLVCHAADRDSAIALAREKLGEFVLLGIMTNTDYLRRILALDAFIAGDTTTAFLPEQAQALLPAAASKAQLHTVLAAAMLNDRPLRAAMAATPHPYGAIGRWRN